MSSLSDQRRIVLYLNDDAKADAKRLLNLLDQQTSELRDHRNQPSMSALFRYLVEQQLTKLDAVDPQ